MIHGSSNLFSGNGIDTGFVGYGRGWTKIARRISASYRGLIEKLSLDFKTRTLFRLMAGEVEFWKKSFSLVDHSLWARAHSLCMKAQLP
jgi:hypothetical protein